MKTAFIIHGTGGNPEGNWFPWLQKELEAKGFQVFVPRFPTPEGQILVSWKEVFERYKKYLSEDTVFIAHSVGPSFVLSILEETDIKISACFFVAGFFGDIQIPEFDRLNDSFVNKEFHWEKIKNNCRYFYMCHGSDDPYVPLENARKMAVGLGVKIDMVEGGGHLNSESGYSEFPYLLDTIHRHS